MTVFLDNPTNQERAPHTVPLAMHVISRPHARKDKPVTRRNILADHKLIVEGWPAETQIILGWIIKTRQLMIALPINKFDAWSGDLHRTIKLQRTTFGNLESTVGRPNHVAYVIPLARHFLTRMPAKLYVPKHKWKSIWLSSKEAHDLTLWTHFLAVAQKGISLDQITIHLPSRLTISDACPFGVGGYSLQGT
jgi:hypothetical protein